MGALFQTWWTAFSGFFGAAASLATGSFTPLPILAALGIVAGVAGVILIALWRVKRVNGLIVLFVAALLAPIAISLAEGILGWVGMLFAVLAGAIILIVGVAVIANNADRRVPVWLFGLFLIDFAFFSALFGGAFASLTA